MRFIVFLTVFVLFEQAVAVSLSEQRIIFEGAKRSHSMRLLNDGAEPITYRISIRAASMAESGHIQFFERDQQPSHSASDLIRFSPRKGMLAPGESQVVRFKIKKKPDLSKGEYYSFVRVLSRPRSLDDGSPKQFAKQMGYNIPVFVRQGNLRDGVKIWLDNPTVFQDEDGSWRLSVWLNRNGIKSLYGAFSVHQGNDVLAFVKGISLYPNINKRKVTLSLSGPPSKDLVVKYLEDSRSGLLSANLNVNPR